MVSENNNYFLCRNEKSIEQINCDSGEIVDSSSINWSDNVFLPNDGKSYLIAFSDYAGGNVFNVRVNIYDISEKIIKDSVFASINTFYHYAYPDISFFKTI